MSRIRISCLAAGLIGIGLAGSGPFAADATNQQLQEKIDALQTQVNQLQVEQQQQKTTDDQATLAKVTADADSHSNLMDVSSPITGGWNPQKWQFFVASEDGSFYFHPYVELQVRYAAFHVRSPDAWQNGFEIRRAKFGSDGNVISKDLTYKFDWQDSNPGGAPTLEWGFAQYVFAHEVFGTQGDLGLKMGQYKDFVFKEEALVGDTNQPLIERSLLNSIIGGNALGGTLVEGVDLVYTGDKTPVHLDLDFDNGDASGLTSFTDVTAAGRQNFGSGFRADWKLMGDWSDNADLSGYNAKNDFFDVGGGIHFSQGSTAAPVGTPSSSTVRADIDAQYTHAKSFFIFGDIIADTIHAQGAAAGPHSKTDVGALIEGGVFLNSAWQLVGRYDVANVDSRFKIAKVGTFHEIGVGANWYLGEDGAAGNHAKVSFDCDYMPRGNPAAAGLDYLAAPNGHDAIALRGQFQLYF